MTIAVQVPGPCKIVVGTGTNGALEDLGYTVNGASIDEDPIYEDVHGSKGNGVPADVLYMGETHIIRLELSKWDAEVAGRLAAKLRGGTRGVVPNLGTFMFAAGLSFRCALSCLASPGYSRNYKRCLIRDRPFGTNLGTKWSKLTLQFIAYPVPQVGSNVAGTGLIWDTSLS